MEEGDLADNPQLLDLYLEAFGLEPTLSQSAHTGSAVESDAVPAAVEGSHSTPLSSDLQV